MMRIGLAPIPCRFRFELPGNFMGGSVFLAWTPTGIVMAREVRQEGGMKEEEVEIADGKTAQLLTLGQGEGILVTRDAIVEIDRLINRWSAGEMGGQALWASLRDRLPVAQVITETGEEAVVRLRNGEERPLTEAEGLLHPEAGGKADRLLVVPLPPDEEIKLGERDALLQQRSDAKLVVMRNLEIGGVYMLGGHSAAAMKIPVEVKEGLPPDTLAFVKFVADPEATSDAASEEPASADGVPIITMK